VAIFLTRKLRCDSLNEIGSQFQTKKYSSISSVIERMKKQMLTDRNLKKRVERVVEGVSKSQEQI
jgi:chromosomal replication initiation ATPase DnaA